MFSNVTVAATFNDLPAGGRLASSGYTFTSPFSICVISRRMAREGMSVRSTGSRNAIDPNPFRATIKFGTDAVEATFSMGGMV
jgi:hypothetical protein